MNVVGAPVRQLELTWSSWLLIPVTVLCPWQLYVLDGLGGLSLLQLTLFPLAGFLFAEALIRSGRVAVPASLGFRILSVLCLACLVAAAWSPDPMLAIRTSVKIGGILLIASAVTAAPQSVVVAATRILIAGSILLGSVIVVFRVVPVLEQGFVFTSLADWVMDPELLSGIRDGTARVNILAADRAGAVFSNANVASLYIGLVACLGMIVCPRSRLWLISVPVATAAVIATGSKSGLTALLLVSLGIATTHLRSRVTLGRIGLAVIIGPAVVALGSVAVYSSGLFEIGIVSGVTRLETWGAAIPALSQAPLTGFGFGGWERWAAEEFRYLGIPERYPPENLLFVVWAWMGLGGVALAGLFSIWAIIMPLTALSRRGPSSSHLGSLLFFIWFVLQSMLTNAAFTDVRIGVPLGIALGLIERDEVPEQ